MLFPGLVARLALVSLLPWLLPAGQTSQTNGRVSVRFHHLHFRVGDPSAAMQTFAGRLGGTRVILQGLGVGVRVENWYLLFDRDREDIEPRAGGGMGVAAARRSAAIWLAGRGLEIQSDGLASSSLATAADVPPLEHIAFAAADLRVAVGVLEARGATPVGRTDDSAMFRLPDGLLVEIVGDTDAADAYWCPMHLDVRSGTASKCPICGMGLVLIPPPRLGEYRMDVTSTPGSGGRGLGGLHLVIRDPKGVPVPAFTTMHERLLHLFLISRNLEYFAHVHPEPAGDGVFGLKHDAPPGEYMVIADFLPQDGATQMVHRAILTPGYNGPFFTRAPALRPDLRDTEGSRWSVAEKTVDGTTIRLEAADLIGGKRGIIRFRLSDAATGVAVTDLEPFLGAPAHVLIVSNSLEDAIHAHPEEQTTASGMVTLLPVMPAPGVYKLWAQFQRRGRVVTVPFVIEAASP